MKTGELPGPCLVCKHLMRGRQRFATHPNVTRPRRITRPSLNPCTMPARMIAARAGTTVQSPIHNLHGKPCRYSVDKQSPTR
jgi:hypothetical protein